MFSFPNCPFYDFPFSELPFFRFILFEFSLFRFPLSKFVISIILFVRTDLLSVCSCSGLFFFRICLFQNCKLSDLSFSECFPGLVFQVRPFTISLFEITQIWISPFRNCFLGDLFFRVVLFQILPLQNCQFLTRIP